LTRSLRCSTAEREQTGQRVHEAAGDGRLSLDEVEERLGRIYAARYQHELDSLVADLPARRGRTGWSVVAMIALQQLGADLALLRGHGRTVDSGTRRLVFVLLATLVIIATMTLAVHGVFFDGAEHRPGLG
jgi:hypothetical protein